LLNFLLESPKEERAREELEKKRYNLFISQYLFTLNQSFKDFLKTKPGYSSWTTFSNEYLRRYWSEYRKQNNVTSQDPWGGALSLDSSGKVATTTPHTPVFGLE
jgi:hypothetical protein